MSTTEVQQPVPIKTAKRHYAAIVTGGLLVVVGILWLLDAIDAVDLQPKILLPSILAVVGIALIVGAFDGPHPGLIVAGVLLTLGSIAVAAAPEGVFIGGIGERNVQVGAQSELEATYGVSLGELNLDMSELDLASSEEVHVSVGAGDLTVILPPDVPVLIEASVGAGEIDLLGDRGEGLSVAKSYASDDFETADVTLTLDLSVAAGNIEVDR